MKSFEIEFAELADWIRQKNDEYIENKKKEIGKSTIKGHDSELNYIYQQDVREYNRRLTELRKKYGKDNILPQEATPRKETERVHL